MRGHFARVSILLLLIITTLLAGCTTVAATPPPVSGKGPIEAELTVLEWSGFEIPEMWADFQRAHPEVSVDFNFGVSDEDIFEQTKEVSGADVVHIYTPFIKFYVDEGLLRELDPAGITHWDEIPQQFRDLCTFEGKVYCVPWDWGLTSIVYRTDKITEPITSWGALFDERYAGHIAMWDSGFGAFEVGSYVLGYDQSNLTDAQLEEIQQLWMDQRAINSFYWVAETDLVQGMTNGDIWLAYGWNAGYYTMLNNGVPVAFAKPEEGRASYVGVYGIPTEATNVNAALSFIDLKLAEQSATNLLTMYGYGHVNPTYYDAVTDPNLITALSLDDPTVLERTQFAKPFTFDAFQKFLMLWQEVKEAQ